MSRPSAVRLLLSLLACATLVPGALAQREKILIDDDWRFALGHATDLTADFNHGKGYFSYLAKTGFGDGPASAAFDDRGWRKVNLPHDWAVEMPFDGRASASHGFRAVGPAFPENSAGWYRKSFSIPESDLGRRISVELDGAYRHARVFVNGFFCGEEPSGYLGVSYDISEYLNYGGENTIVVRVDASAEEGWFYEGAGIYRHVWLTKKAPLHIARNGTFVRAELAADFSTAHVRIETVVENQAREAHAPVVRQQILSPEGRVLGTSDTPLASVPAGTRTTYECAIALSKPALWSLETPALHRLITTVLSDGKEVDRYETSFGVRSIRFDPNAGFFLNGKHVVLKGSNNHQDHAGVGVAVPDRLQEWRIQKLKTMGSNAYRASHHPATDELLEACDRLGMLVIDENRLMGINPYHLGQLEELIRRGRNHPSIILWSIGNEEWGIEGNIKGERITVPMQDLVHRLDPTRPVTAAISGGWGGISASIEVAGVNYINQADPDKQHRLKPAQIIVGTEETTTQGTRGVYVDDRDRCHLAPVENGSSGGNAELGWKFYAERPYTAGVFFWTGFDYRGEPTPFGYPATASQFGILDTCGFPKDGFYYLKSWWTDEPVLHVFPHWNWPGRDGKPIEVTVNSNFDTVELLLNGASLGSKNMPKNGHLTWTVPYAPGKLSARGKSTRFGSAESVVATTGPAATIAATPHLNAISADGRDLAVVDVSIHDAAGSVVPVANVPLAFSVQGPGRIIGVGNGDPSSHEPDQFVGAVRTVALGRWQAPDPSVKTGQIVFETTFDAPVLAEGEAGALLLNALGTSQTVTLNGEVLANQAAPSQARTSLALKAGQLREKGNTLRIEATRFEQWRDREGLFQFHPATLRIETPAPQWRRSTFNGYAQVIVQSTGEPGTITLTTTSPGLKDSLARIEATRAVNHP